MNAEKSVFVEDMKIRTRSFARAIIKFVNTLITSKASAVITYQLVKSATSVGANYRAACGARSQAEFFSKICIVVEETDESEYWLALIHDTSLSTDQVELDRLRVEIMELSKIFSKAKFSTYKTK